MDVNNVVAFLSNKAKRERKPEDHVGRNQHVKERIFLQAIRRPAFVRQRFKACGRIPKAIDLQSVDAMIAQAAERGGEHLGFDAARLQPLH